MNGDNVTKRIRENDVNDFVSPVSTIKIVRHKLLEIQRKIAEGKNVIMEGRDIGTTVFPKAEMKIYLDAIPEGRAKKRVLQNNVYIIKKGEKPKDGVAFFAVRSGAKVVPCGIKGGTKEYRKVPSTYGEPLDYSKYKGSKDKEVFDNVTEEIMNKIINIAI